MAVVIVNLLNQMIHWCSFAMGAIGLLALVIGVIWIIGCALKGLARWWRGESSDDPVSLEVFWLVPLALLLILFAPRNRT